MDSILQQGRRRTAEHYDAETDKLRQAFRIEALEKISHDHFNVTSHSRAMLVEHPDTKSQICETPLQFRHHTHKRISGYERVDNINKTHLSTS
jgi:hypothetical protein